MAFNPTKIFEKLVDEVIAPVAEEFEEVGDDIVSGAEQFESIVEGISADGTPLSEGDQDLKVNIVSEEVKERNQELRDLKESNERSAQRLENQERAMIQSMMRSSQSGSSQGTILGDNLGTEKSEGTGGRFKGKSLLGE